VKIITSHLRQRQRPTQQRPSKSHNERGPALISFPMNRESTPTWYSTNPLPWLPIATLLTTFVNGLELQNPSPSKPRSEF
jgi:hypothetical protein